MSIAHLTKFHATLAKPLKPTDTAMVLRVAPRWLDKVNTLPDGDVVYFMLDYYDRYELVKFEKQGKLSFVGGAVTMPIERGQFHTTIQSWPSGNCVRYELTGEIVAAMLEPCCQQNEWIAT